jgi:hypothetical protein
MCQGTKRKALQVKNAEFVSCSDRWLPNFIIHRRDSMKRDDPNDVEAKNGLWETWAKLLSTLNLDAEKRLGPSEF